MTDQQPFFEMRHITKYFSRVIANQDVTLEIRRGEVLALLGENGAGKSTIMKILYGLYHADQGTILRDGAEQVITSPRDAMKLGIAMIQQHFSLVPAHTVIENIILGTVRGTIDYSSHEAKLTALAQKYGFAVDPHQKISDLDVGQQQKVEILKALYMDASLLIMDEPTAVLTPQETDHLIQFIRDFTDQGNAVIFITHKLKEVMAVADRIVVMRDGVVMGNVLREDTSEPELSRLMIGRKLDNIEKKGSPALDSGNVVLSVSDLTCQDEHRIRVLDGISFDIHEGEIFGIAGVSGNGQEELCEALCGLLPPLSGEISLHGQPITHASIRERIDQGIGYVPVDRHKDAMISAMTLSENMLLRSSFAKRWSKGLFLNEPALKEYTQDLIGRFNVKTPGPDERIGRLSGGNQQKAIVGREIDLGTSLLLINQPTRGLDLGAINNIHATILKQREAGKSVLLISTELSEVFALSDRIGVMFKGRLMGIYRPEELDTEKIGLLMAGYPLEGEVSHA